MGLANTKHVILPEVLPRLIDTLVMLQIRYCVQVYGSVGPTVLGKIQKVFNFAARIVSWQRKYDHTSDVMEKLKWLNSRQLVDYSDLCMFHKVILSGLPVVL